jgi:hypothetical protein
MLKQSVARSLRLAQLRVQRRTTARLVLARARARQVFGRATPRSVAGSTAAGRVQGPTEQRRADTVVVKLQGTPVEARVDPGLHLSTQRRAAFDLVKSALVDAGLQCWHLPRIGIGRLVLGVDAADRQAVQTVLAEHPVLRDWYRDRLNHRGQLTSRLERAGDGLPDSVPAIAVWEHVVADPNSSFGASELQGVEIQFWTRPEDALEPTLMSPVPSATVTLLLESEVRDLQGAAPAMFNRRHASKVGFDIDIVYTWVDGSDETWLAQKLAASGRPSGRVHTERAHDESRFADHDELRYSLRSVEQFAPWVNHIWIVTSGQRPAWLADHPKVTVVSHQEIWPDQEGLPTFNSHAIEACLHRIPGLSEHFLYLNDDMIFGRPVAPELFFQGSGLGRFFWSRALVDYLPSYRGEIASTSAAKNARRLIEERFGVTFSRKFFHAAYPLRVSVLEELEREFPDVFKATRRASFRTTDDVAAAGSLYFNYAYVTGRAVPGVIRYDYVDPAVPIGLAKMDNILRNRTFDAFCINDGGTPQTMEERQDTDREIRRFLATYLPVRSEFEIEQS